eukprot:3175693-Rhodomonas_salina.1
MAIVVVFEPRISTVRTRVPGYCSGSSRCGGSKTVGIPSSGKRDTGIARELLGVPTRYCYPAHVRAP